MKTPLLSALICLTTATLFAQGTLLPSGPPVQSMKSLAQIEPRTPISSLPWNITQPGSYYVTTNLLTTNGNGIQIMASGVVLDLGGFHLTGTGAASSGVYLFGPLTNIVVRHGTLSGWNFTSVDGATYYLTVSNSDILFEDLHVSDSPYGITSAAKTAVIRQCSSSSNYYTGFSAVNAVISECQASGSHNGFQLNYCSASHCVANLNTQTGFYVVDTTLADCESSSNTQANYYLNASQATGCHADTTPGDGFDLVNSALHHCLAQNSSVYGVQIETGDCEVADCFIRKNTNSGLIAYGTGSSSIHDNTFVSNNATNAFIGSLMIFANNCRIDNNRISGGLPAGYGLYVSSSFSNNVVTRNSVMGNGAKNYYVPGPNDLGPVGGATNSTSPWANISH